MVIGGRVLRGLNIDKDILCPMNAKESLVGGQKCNYSSSIVRVERRYLPHYFDFQCIYLAYSKYICHIVLKCMISIATSLSLEG